MTWLLDRAPALLSTAVGPDGRHRHRLFHAAFAESVSPDPAALASGFFDGLLDAVPVRADGRRDWTAAPTYVRRYLAHHAQEADRLGDLLGEAGYLTVADPGDVLRAQERSGHVLGREISHVLAGFTARPLPEEAADRAAAIALRLRYRGRDDLADEVLRTVPAAGWRPLWFQGPPAGIADSHQGAVRSVTTSGTLIVSCADDGALMVRLLTDDGFGPATVLDAHVGGATAVADLPGAVPRLITGGVDGGLAIWDTSTWSVLARFPGAHDGPVTAIVPADDGFVTAGADGTVRAWNPDDLDEVNEPARAHIGGVVGLVCAAIGPDAGEILVSAGWDGRMTFWDPIDGTDLGSFDDPGGGGLTAFALHAVDGVGYAITGSSEGSVSVWTITARLDEPVGDEARLMPIRPVFSCNIRTFNITGRPAVTAACVLTGPDGPLWVCAAGAELIAELFADDSPHLSVGGVEGVSALSSIADPPRVLAGGHNGTLRAWSCVRSRSLLETNHGPDVGLPNVSGERSTTPTTVTAVGAAKGPFIVVARGGSGGYQTTIETPGYVTTETTTRYDTRVRPTVTVLSATDGIPAGPERTLDAPAVLALTVAPEPGGWKIAAVGRDGTCRSWQTGAAELRERALLRHPFWHLGGQLAAVTAAPTPAFVAVSYVGGLWVLDADRRRSRRRRRVPRSHKATVLATGVVGGRPVVASWSPSETSTVYVWELATGRQLARHVDDRIVRISTLAIRDGLLAAGGTDGAVTLFHLDDRLAPLGTNVHSGHLGRVSALCALNLPSGATVTVSGGHDGDLRFWPQPRSGEHPIVVSLGSPVQCACPAGPGILVVGTELGVVCLQIDGSAA
ncbi:hypothetical protein [Dactylosporangium sp. NPDC048998]|uniref:WD40 repeat domain-containing protein n=1 Tax=Dactylosporangium sp. NPDC048998 TaxID=3363976 RepID=UPI003718D080